METHGVPSVGTPEIRDKHFILGTILLQFDSHPNYPTCCVIGLKLKITWKFVVLQEILTMKFGKLFNTHIHRLSLEFEMRIVSCYQALP